MINFVAIDAKINEGPHIGGEARAYEATEVSWKLKCCRFFEPVNFERQLLDIEFGL
jgi:hypothetical protein